MQARSPDGKTPGKRNLPAKVSLQVDRTVPETPSEITGRGFIEWEKLWQAGWWLQREQDYPWIEMICHAYMDIETWRERVAEDGLVVTGYAGQVVAHPLIAEIRKAEATIQKCLQVLGFSPTDRAKLAINQRKAMSALEEMITASQD
jgi:P27 family predicted phage terminase small subunit